MNIEELRDKIEAHIANGHADKAVAELVNYTKVSRSPIHEDAIVLSGQLRQWKRENMLGIQQSSNDLNRIKMSVLLLVKSLEEAPHEPVPSSLPPSPPPMVQQAPVREAIPMGKSSINTGAIIIGIAALILFTGVGWYFLRSTGDPPSQAAGTEQMVIPELSASGESALAQTNTSEDKKTSLPETATPAKKDPTPAANNTTTQPAPASTTSSPPRTNPSVREVVLPNIIATVKCSGRTYKLGDDNRVYDTTSSPKKIGTSTASIKCEDGVLVAKILPQYGGYLTFYNQSKNDWMETMAEAVQ